MSIPPPLPAFPHSPPSPKLWSPRALGVMAFFFLPISAVLAIFNWRALGHPKQARSAIGFIVLILAVVGLAGVLPEGSPLSGTWIAPVLLGSWYGAVLTPMRQAIANQLPSGYRKRALWPGWVVVAAIYALLLLPLFLDGAPSLSQAETTTREIFQKSWYGDGQSAARIDALTLEPNGKTRYKGRITVALADRTEQFDLETWYDQDGKQMHAQIAHGGSRLITFQVLSSLWATYRQKPGLAQCRISELALQEAGERHYDGTFILETEQERSSLPVAVNVGVDGNIRWEVPASS